ncbi:MAG: hypothetical protein KY451_02745 [Actinobacteria bacterium]|nr:hypothetical protein [Actinomycetota bacterium]
MNQRPRRAIPAVVSRALSGAVLAWTAQRVLTARPPGGAPRWERTNHRGRPVSLLSGPALALAAVATADLPVAAAGAAGFGAAVVGGYDDAVGDRSARGFRGHLAALRRGRLTSGGVKVLGIGVAGLLACSRPGVRRREILLEGAVVAASANLLNLLDLRPGRALKAGAVAALVLGQPGPAAAAAALLPADLGERAMLGDAGANALGAVLGLALVRRHPQRRLIALTTLTAATAVSEVLSYSRIIDAVPPLSWVDRVGRQP